MKQSTKDVLFVLGVGGAAAVAIYMLAGSAQQLNGAPRRRLGVAPVAVLAPTTRLQLRLRAMQRRQRMLRIQQRLMHK